MTPVLVFLKPMLSRIIDYVTNNNGYTGPGNSIKYMFEIDERYVWETYDYGNRIDASDGNARCVMFHGMPRPSEPLRVYMFEFDHTVYFVKKLSVYNLTSWNKDDRCRGKHPSIPNSDTIHPEWYAGYSDIFEKEKEEITLDDLVEGLYAVKSGKLDCYYELLKDARCRLDKANDNHVHMSVFLRFGHGK